MNVRYVSADEKAFHTDDAGSRVSPLDRTKRESQSAGNVRDVRRLRVRRRFCDAGGGGGGGVDGERV